MENEQERRKWRVFTRVLILLFLVVIVMGVLSLLMEIKVLPKLTLPHVAQR